MIKARKIELLAPAKNLECGIEAIKHGADAVYIGAPKFSARAAVGNSLNDIKLLAEYAHMFNARVYVALNTILDDKELEEVELMIWQLYNEAKADALIIQDMGILKLDLPPIPLHASTQNDNRELKKIKFLEKVGFKQIVLARELTIDDIRTIASEIETPLEIFIHGALCVCYSGQCYISQALSGRSANKGVCAQYCRLPYRLTDSNGTEITSRKHLLSMKDLNLSENIEDLLDAGASSLKIEGRLKEVSYVKNIVSYYRKKLDAVMLRRPEFIRSSSGFCNYTFEPDPAKSFNRGFTKYFLEGRTQDIWSVNSPKSIGEPLGKITEITTKFIKINTNVKLNNGDGLCFINIHKELEGIHVNRVDGNLIFPSQIPEIRKGTFIYRNLDHNFERLLSKDSSTRKINIEIRLNEQISGFSGEITDEDGNSVTINFYYKKEKAQKSQLDNIRNNLSKTGNTIFKVNEITITCSNEYFIPASVVSEWRRQLLDKLLMLRRINYKQDIVRLRVSDYAFPLKEINYLGNVMNSKSKRFYIEHQVDKVENAYEKHPILNIPLMHGKHCIKYSMGWCPKEGVINSPYVEPFFLNYKNIDLRLSFDCKACEMKIYNKNE